MTRPTVSTRHAIVGIMLALALWGGYLAVGATGMFLDGALFDARKSAIVIACVGVFLGFWVVVLWKGRPHQGSQPAHPTIATEGDVPPLVWSKAGLVSLVLSVLGLGLWAVSVLSWRSVATSTSTQLGWLAACFLLGAATAGLVAVSDRPRRRGKWLGYVGLIVLFGSLVGYVIRMKP